MFPKKVPGHITDSGYFLAGARAVPWSTDGAEEMSQAVESSRSWQRPCADENL